MSWGQGLAIFGSLLSAAGSLREGAAAKAAAEENARRALYDAAASENIFRKKFARQQSTARTTIAKSGVTMSGSALDVISESAANAEIDAITARYDAINQASSLRRQGREAQKASYMRAGAQLLSGSGQIF